MPKSGFLGGIFNACIGDT
jgi:hypothetical protein